MLSNLIWANYFGRTFLGTIRGVSQVFRVISMGGGPLLCGCASDVTKSYQFIFTVYIGLFLLASLMMFFIKPPKVPS